MTITYDIPTRRHWMRTVTVGTAVDVKYQDTVYRAKIVRVGKSVVWVSRFTLADGSAIHPHSTRFNRKTGEGWGTNLVLFPVNDAWITLKPEAGEKMEAAQ